MTTPVKTVLSSWLPILMALGAIIAAAMTFGSRVTALEVQVSERKEDIQEIRDDVKSIKQLLMEHVQDTKRDRK
jgi:uncharacterized protein YqgV (UPF0045/DUF77 family)